MFFLFYLFYSILLDFFSFIYRNECNSFLANGEMNKLNMLKVSYSYDVFSLGGF